MLTSVIDIGEKFIIGVIVTGNNFSAVSMTPVINLSPVSTTPPMKENPWQRLITGVSDTAHTAKQFIAGVVDTADKHSFAIILANFRKKSKWS
jgi:hypothetical protein